MYRNSSNTIKRTYGDKIFDAVNIVIMLVLLFIFVWPLWFVLIASFSNPMAVAKGEVLFLPKGITLEGYKMMLEYKSLWVGYANTILCTAAGTVINLILTVCCAYPLSTKDFLPRKVITYLLMFTMYFSGGIIPLYLVVKEVGLVNTRWAMIIPGAISFYNCLVVRSYMMNSIPGELKEAATLDGANAAQYLIKVVLPLSKPVLAVVGLYYLVGHWNDYRSALLYIYDEAMYPLQTVLRNLLSSVSYIDVEGIVDPEELDMLYKRSMQMKYCVIIAAALPMLCAYPFIQKFFVKGVMVGSVKG
ncbi:MAG: carbohydrate ABC transporter permease [Lachnospiraceae bacterium]|nr:carbohydrate ABC transporter permease [Lachnospiraceae bacterium]